MTIQPSFANIEYIGSPLLESAMRTQILPTEHKGGIGTVLGVVAAIAVPVIAPTIATAIFGGASILGSALTGAALGAGTSALTGGNPLVGALTGGVGAGASSFFAGAPLGFGSVPVADASGAAVNSAYMASGAPLPVPRPADLTTAYLSPTGTVPGATPILADAGSTLSGQQYAYAPTSTMSDVYSIDGVPTNAYGNASLNVGATAENVVPAANTATANTATGGTLTVAPAATSTATNVGATGVFTSPLPQGASFVTAPPNMDLSKFTPYYEGITGIEPAKNFLGFGGVDSSISKFIVDGAGNTYINPAWQQAAATAATKSGGLTNALIQGGVNLAGMAMSQLGGNPQQEIVDKYSGELAKLKKTDQAAYEAKKKEVEGLIASAKAMDPGYFGQQQANAAKIAGTRGLMESFRETPLVGLRSPEFTASETRRASLGIGQNVGTAYDQGYGTGLTARQSALSSAINQMPNPPSRYLDSLRTLAGLQGTAGQYGAQSAQGYSNLFGSFARPFLTTQV